MERCEGWKKEKVVVNLFGRKMLAQAQRGLHGHDRRHGYRGHDQDLLYRDYHKSVARTRFSLV